MLEYFYVSLKSRNSQSTTNYAEAKYIPFELKFGLPKLRKWRIISQRDKLGRIKHSVPPKARFKASD